MSTGRQRRARRRRKENARARGEAQRQAAAPDRATPDLVAGLGLFAEILRGTTGPNDALAKVRANVANGLRDIVDKAQGHGLIDVVQGIRSTMHLRSQLTGQEIQYAAIELVALALSCRDAGGDLVIEREPDPDDPYLPDSIYETAERVLDIGSLTVMFELDRNDAYAEAAHHTVAREVRVRNMVYPDMLYETAKGLFDDPQVAADLKATVGFTGLDALDVMTQVGAHGAERLESRFKRMLDARDASEPILRAQGGGQGLDLSPETIEVMTEVHAAIVGLTTTIAETAVLDVDEIASRAGASAELANAVIDRFTVAPTADVDAVADRFFHGDNPLRAAPIVRDRAGRRMLVHEALALPAVREVLEEALKGAGRLDSYEKHRGRWVEDTALDLLADVLPGAEVRRAFEYFVPDPKAAAPQMTSAEYTKLVEGDGLIIIDDVALIIEVKAVALTAQSRSGVIPKLRTKLRDIITKAAMQASRLRDRIVDDNQLRLRDGQTLDLSSIREIHTIAVGLEDLSGVSTATAMLIDAGVLPGDHIPWTVSIHDLRIISELTDYPSELLLYLRRRTHPEATRKYLAVDELDLYMHFLKHGLYVEPDPHNIAANHPWHGKPTLGDVQRRQNQGRELISSMTAPLDAWYQSRVDPRTTAAQKPASALAPAFRRLLQAIEATGSHGWLSTGAMLLEGSASARREMTRFAPDMGRMVRNDGQFHTAAQPLIDSAGNGFLLVWACCGTRMSEDEHARHFGRYLAAKKYQLDMPSGAVLMFDQSGKHLKQLIYDSSPVQDDPQLEALAATLKPITAREKVPTQAAIRGKRKKRGR